MADLDRFIRSAALERTTAGNSGAKKIGTSGISGILSGTPSNIQLILEALKAYTDTRATSLTALIGTQGVPTGGATGEVLTKNSSTNYDTVWRQRYVDIGYINGLKPEYLSATQLTISSGACYIPASGKILEKTTDTTYTPSSPALVASTLYYLFAVESAGSLAFEHSTSAPSVYFARAKQRNDSNARRYIGEFRTATATNNIVFFQDVANTVLYRPDTNVFVAPWRVYNAAPTLTPTTVNCSPIVPAFAKQALLHVNNYGSRAIAFGDPTTVGASVYSYYNEWQNGYGATDQFWIALNSSQQFALVANAGAATGNTSVACVGYRRER